MANQEFLLGPLASREEHPMSHGNTLSLGQHANLIAALAKAAPRNIDPKVARKWEQDGALLSRVLDRALCKPKFRRNGNGHFIISLKGSNLTGAAELSRLDELDIPVERKAGEVLESLKKTERLGAEKYYKVALLPTKEIKYDRERTTENAIEFAAEKYGYKKPLMGIMPPISRLVLDADLEEMGFNFIVGLHTSLKDEGWLCWSGDFPHIPCRGCLSLSPQLPSNYGWRPDGAFAFLVPVRSSC